MMSKKKTKNDKEFIYFVFMYDNNEDKRTKICSSQTFEFPFDSKKIAFVKFCLDIFHIYFSTFVIRVME